MKELTVFIQQRLYPVLFEQIPRVFTEHQFKKVGQNWHSPTYLNGENHAHRTDKTVITAGKPSHILEQGGQALSLLDYVMQRDGCSFIQAVQYLAVFVGLGREFEDLSHQNVKNGIYSQRNTTTYKSVHNRTNLYEEKLPYVHKCTDLDTSVHVHNYYYHKASVLADYEELTHNHFVAYLAKLPGWNRELAENAVKNYQVGTAKKGVFSGSPIFWRFNQKGKLCPSKIMRYEKDGKRAKTPPLLTWTKRKAQYAPLQNPPHYYGLPLLLEDNVKPVALVESEKTAIIASMYLPQFTWIATGGDSYFSAKVNNVSIIRMQPLKNRQIVLFPDLDKIESWQNKAHIWAEEGFDIHLNTFVKKNSHLVPNQTADLADFFAQINLQDFLINTHNSQ